MRAVVQRVSHASIHVEGTLVAEMGVGLLALVGVAREDGPRQACELAERLVRLRVFPDAQGRMNRSLLETGGTLGVVSQFTLMGDARKGRRPAFTAAAPGPQAEPLVEALANAARGLGAPVVTGRFGAQMQIVLRNEGPVTLLLDTERRF
ncbi:MAG TPA: D-aminoacyl-tRNA deacylase [Myxococcota bacterium]|nr:D-aminoacyl-tRNA deacylase [Myxococcota bacterium]